LGIVGGHLNPAVSFTLFVLGQLRFTHFIAFTAAQTGACFLAAGATYQVYWGTIIWIEIFEINGGGLRSAEELHGWTVADHWAQSHRVRLLPLPRHTRHQLHM
jgi:glycerol uptake facilitator-like aquaporin